MLPRSVPLSLSLAAFALLSMAAPCRAMIEINGTWSTTAGYQQNIDYQAVRAFQFGDDPHLSFALSLDQPPPSITGNYSVQVLVCSYGELSAMHLPDGTTWSSVWCDESAFVFDASTIPCTFHTLLGTNDKLTRAPFWSVAREFGSEDLSSDSYYLFINNCDRQGASGLVTWIARSGDEWLSQTDVPFKALYVITGVLWSLILAMWAVHLFRWRAFNIKLQSLVLVSLVSRAIVTVPYASYFYVASRTGYWPSGLQWPILIVETLDSLIFFVLLVLISKGWAVLHASFTKKEWREIVVYSLIQTVCYALLSLFLKSVIASVIGLGFLFVLRYVLMSIITTTKQILDALSSLMNTDFSNGGDNATIVIQSTPLWQKLQIYKVFQLSLLLYVSVYVITSLYVSISSRTPNTWLYRTVIETINLALAVVIVYCFMLRPFNPFYYYIVELYAKRGEQESRAVQQSQSQPQSLMPRTEAEASNDDHQSRRRLANGNDLSQSLLGDYDGVNDDHQLQQQLPASLSEPAIPVWRPGLPVPPFPDTPNQWLQNEEEESAPLIILTNPDATVDIGQLHSEKPPSRIPAQALQYFPRDLVHSLTRSNDHDSDDEGGHSDSAMSNASSHNNNNYDSSGAARSVFARGISLQRSDAVSDEYDGDDDSKRDMF